MGRGRSEASKQLIEAAIEILEQIQPCSVRAVCYQLFNRKLIDSMLKPNTNKVGTQLVWAREHGEIDWDWISDETRQTERPGTWSDPAAFAEVAKRSFRRDAWQHQPVRIEVWSEKATVGGTVRPVLEEYGVAFRIFHGYGSATAVRSAAEESVSDARPLKVYYIGDYDPSGLHMSAKDLPERLERYGGEVELIRLALTAEDINSNLPSFPLSSKKGDPRCRWYREKAGLSQCWELDALSPVTLRDRLRANIEAEIDWAAWNRTLACEKAEKKSLDMVLAEWKRIIAEGSPRMEE